MSGLWADSGFSLHKTRLSSSSEKGPFRTGLGWIESSRGGSVGASLGKVYVWLLCRCCYLGGEELHWTGSVSIGF